MRADEPPVNPRDELLWRTIPVSTSECWFAVCMGGWRLFDLEESIFRRTENHVWQSRISLPLLAALECQSQVRIRSFLLSTVWWGKPF